MVNALIFSASGNYLTEINRRGSDDESGRSLEAILVPLHESAPISCFNAYQTPVMAAKDGEDEEVWEDDDEDDEEDWDDEDDDDEDWDDEDDDDEDWDDDERLGRRDDEEEDYDEDEE